MKIRTITCSDYGRIITIDGDEEFKIIENDDKIILIFNKNK